MARIVGIIPARWASTRLEGKVLADIAGKPMIQHVYERASQAQLLERVIVATDDERIRRAVEVFGGEAQMTRADHACGTDRVAEVAASLGAEIIVNIQGDEPLMAPDNIDAAIAPLARDACVPMGTLRTPVRDEAELHDPSVVKVVVDAHGFALYFSRHPIPFIRDADRHVTHSRHVGLYVYRRDFLLHFAGLPPTPLEQAESLEQLRALEHGFRVIVSEVADAATGIDTPAQLEQVRWLLKGD